MFSQIKNFFFNKNIPQKGFSVICVYNNREKLEKFLIKSLRKQIVPYELISIDNTTGKFHSAAQLLNEAAKNSKYEYLMFVHQDISLGSKKWLYKARRDLEKLNLVGAVGVAGKFNDKFTVASVRHGYPPHFVGKRMKKPTNVQTLDGCLMIVAKETFSRIPFDEKVVNGWIFYVANYCLDLIRYGYRNYVLPYDVYHESTGWADQNTLQKTMNKIIARHRDHIKTIFTTAGTWETGKEK